MSNITKNDINIEKFTNNVLYDNVLKQNLSTFINKYTCDTLYILQLQINSFLSKKDEYLNIDYKSCKNQNVYYDEIDLIKNINNYLEKEIFYINNSKKEETSKFVEILCKRNKLLNILMLHFFEKSKNLEKKEKILDEKIKYYSYKLSKYNIKSSKCGNKIETNNKTIKNRNEFYNDKRLSKYLNTSDINMVKEMNNYNEKKKKAKTILNKSYDIISINNIDTSCSFNNDGININYDYKYKKDPMVNLKCKLKLKKINSVSGMVNKDSIINFNNKNYFKYNNQTQLNKINLDKLNSITSNIHLLNQEK